METEGADYLPYWIFVVNGSLGEDANGLVEAIQHLWNTQSAENEAVTVQSISEAVMLYGLTTVQ